MSEDLLATFREKIAEESLKHGSKPEGEDENSPTKAMGGGGDPAVLALGPLRKVIAYTRDELMHLKNSPLSKQPLDPALLAKDGLSQVLKKLLDWPNDEDRGGRGDASSDNQKGAISRDRDRKVEDRDRVERERDRSERKPADPRERVRKESESGSGGIVLSPQRRSFTSGCNAARPRQTSPTPPITINKPEPTRRIGSGRIMVRDVGSWERGERSERSDRSDRNERTDRSDDNDRNDRDRPEREIYRPPANRDNGASSSRNNNERYDRRSFGRDSYEMKRERDRDRERDDRYNNDKMRDREENRRSNNNGRYGQRRYEKDEEPEWFSGGPTSQLDTIELRGFDEPTKKSTAAQVAANGNANGKDPEKWNKSNSSGGRSPQLERWRSDPEPESPEEAAAEGAAAAQATLPKEPEPVVEPQAPAEPAAAAEQPDFNLDDFLKFDTIPDVLTNGVSESEGSRFSRWFRRESPTAIETRQYERLVHMVEDLDKPRTDPAPAQGMFAPISPAAAPPSLLDLLRRANADKDSHHEVNNASMGKMHNVGDLECRLRSQQSPHPDRDLVAFKRLLAQVSGGVAVPAESPRAPPNAAPAHHAAHVAHNNVHQPPMSLMQMLNKSMEASQQQQAAPPHPVPNSAPTSAPHIPQELLYKLLQVQRQQQPPQELAPPPQNSERELLQRPEAQAIIHGLKVGEITPGHLMQQLNNPGLQSRHRELLLTILRTHQQRQAGGGGGGGGGVSPAPPHLAVPPHHQPLRLSPTGLPARIPSPRELAAHTQSIMQSALIKKKLEEQRENYRRRHELPAPAPLPLPAHSNLAAHNHAARPHAHTPISFTPTSVLRKMTAEKDAESMSPKQQWGQHMPKMPQGRPIVKGNQGGGPQQMGYSPSPAEYQQYLNQQIQMPPAMRSYPHPQQRQMPTNQMNNMSNLTRGVAGGTTLQQLLLQTHQRTLNEMSGGGGGVGAGGGDNQLARWFSPELLARAHAGKLPSARVPNALALEDLERGHHAAAPAPPLRN